MCNMPLSVSSHCAIAPVLCLGKVTTDSSPGQLPSELMLHTTLFSRYFGDDTGM